jgi:hypothetical protein
LFEAFPFGWHLREHSNARHFIMDAFFIREYPTAVAHDPASQTRRRILERLQGPGLAHVLDLSIQSKMPRLSMAIWIFCDIFAPCIGHKEVCEGIWDSVMIIWIFCDIFAPCIGHTALADVNCT